VALPVICGVAGLALATVAVAAPFYGMYRLAKHVRERPPAAQQHLPRVDVEFESSSDWSSEFDLESMLDVTEARREPLPTPTPTPPLPPRQYRVERRITNTVSMADLHSALPNLLDAGDESPPPLPPKRTIGPRTSRPTHTRPVPPLPPPSPHAAAENQHNETETETVSVEITHL